MSEIRSNMKTYVYIMIIGWFFAIFSGCAEQEFDSPRTDLYLWSHNDYEQQIPLHAALDLGFQMIEADIHLINGYLYVIHDHPENIQGVPLLEELYLAPLRERITQNAGDVLPGESLPFYLVIDIKTGAEDTFEALLEILDSYSDLFYKKEGGVWVDGPVRLLISGNRPALDPDSPDRIAFLDGRIPDIGMGLSSDLYPLISDNWFNYFEWNGTGELPEEERIKLREYVSQAHQENKLIRFWGMPDSENVWQVLVENGVDVINVDDIEGLRKFLGRESED